MWSLLLLMACQAPGDGSEPGSLRISSLSVEPQEATVRTGPAGGEELRLAAWATTDDGSLLELDTVEWDVSNRTAGEVDQEGLFTPSIANGGVTWVRARYAGEEARSTVTVLYTDELVDGGDPSLFEGPVRELDEDPWLYPEDGVNLPRNTPLTFFQWRDTGADGWRLRFTSTVSDITVYTDEPGWVSDERTWQVIAGTNAGGTVAVELAAAVGGEVHVAPELHVEVNRMDARGTIYYWSSSVAGLKRIPYGAEEAENYLSRYETDGVCVGCHAISSSEEPLLAYTYLDIHAAGDGSTGFMEVAGVDDLTYTLTHEEEERGNIKSFSPDGEHLLVTRDGSLLLYHAHTGELLEDVTPWDEASGDYYAIPNVDWSPDGSQVAVVLAEHLGLDVRFRRGKVAVMDWLGQWTLGAPEILVDPMELLGEGEWNAYYPAWSPDGRWLAFNISTGDSYDDEDAELWVVSTDGGEPVRLDSANMAGGLTNSWPRWGPLPDDEVLWITFSSRRDYGYVAVEGEPQIWVSAFDPRLVDEGDDPSYPAFWLPGQLSDENNHVPVWIE